MMADRQETGCEINRREACIGGGAVVAIAAMPGLSTLPAAAAGDLQAEVEAYRQAWALSRLPEAKCGSWVTGEDPGPLFARAMREKIRTSEALFLTPARCADDVLRKYAMLDEFSVRGLWLSMSRPGFGGPIGKRMYQEWFDLLEVDAQRFNVDINPWWREGASKTMMIDGRDVIWRERAWHTVSYNDDGTIGFALMA